jgi:hypothetical protein
MVFTCCLSLHKKMRVPQIGSTFREPGTMKARKALASIEAFRRKGRKNRLKGGVIYWGTT